MSDIIFSRVVDFRNLDERRFAFTQEKIVLGTPFNVTVAKLTEDELFTAITDGIPVGEDDIEPTTGLPMEAIWDAYRNMPEFIKTGPINT